MQQLQLLGRSRSPSLKTITFKENSYDRYNRTSHEFQHSRMDLRCRALASALPSCELAMRSTPVHVLIVDDEKFFRDTLKAYLAPHENILVVATAENGEEALEVLDKIVVDVVLCDVRMPLLDGLEFTRQVTEHNIDCKVLALTSFLDDHVMLGMLNAGALGFLLKTAGRDSIYSAILEAAKGGTTISPAAATGLRKYLIRPTSMVDGLPTRERDVLVLLHSGKSNVAIAEALEISMASVKRAISNLMQRFNAVSRTELIVLTR